MLTQPLLAQAGIRHGFGTRGTPEPEGLLRPRQVHGCDVVTAAECRRAPCPEADAVVSIESGVAVGVVTADCVPVLLASEDGRAVAAVHAGWRGLACGILARGVDALRQGCGDQRILAAIGPCIGGCCYEVDVPVLDALEARCGPLGAVTRRSRPGHALLDLGALVGSELGRLGLAQSDVARLPDACTHCDPVRFHSYRRDGARAGRLVHFVAASGSRTRSAQA